MFMFTNFDRLDAHREKKTKKTQSSKLIFDSEGW